MTMLRHLEEFGYDVWIDTKAISYIGGIKRSKNKSIGDYEPATITFSFSVNIDGDILPFKIKQETTDEAVDQDFEALDDPEKLVTIRNLLIDDLKKYRG